MANQPLTQKSRFLRRKESRTPDLVHADRKSAEARPVPNNLRFQIERWVNEGGAGGEDTAPPMPERIGRDHKP